MHKIRKLQFGTGDYWKWLNKDQKDSLVSINYQTPVATSVIAKSQINPNKVQTAFKNHFDLYPTLTLTNDVAENSNIGQGVGAIFSQGVSSAFNRGATNLLKGATFTQGMEQDAASSLAGAATGFLANSIGKGINSLGGDSVLSRGFGQGIATGLGTVGGTVASNLINYGKAAGNASKLFGTGDSIWTTTKTIDGVKSSAGAINPYALGAQVVGTGLQAAFGPSKEYGGKYGNITQTMDSVYDAAQTAIGFVPGWGQAAAGVMALNKGLSNIFGSTDGMTTQDAILGSAFMPAPVKWLNMAGAKKTGQFYGQSWQNQQKANSFMGNAFGDLGDRFDQARTEAGKTYGTFSHSAYRKAQNNLNFANSAWNTILAMADQNELQNIRSQYMSSINNQRYAQNIQGGWSPMARGKHGMKIFNNATNHNIGMRLLSGAALIDNKQMILCSAVN